jgi:hypothetical protein
MDANAAKVIYPIGNTMLGECVRTALSSGKIKGVFFLIKNGNFDDTEIIHPRYYLGGNIEITEDEYHTKRLEACIKLYDSVISSEPVKIIRESVSFRPEEEYYLQTLAKILRK